MSQIVRIDSPAEGLQHAYIATPATTLHSNYLLSLVRTLPQALGRGIGVTYTLLEGHPHVDDARNMLVADFLQTSCTDLFFIDADVGWQWQAFIKAMMHKVDVVAGVYPFKDDEVSFPVRVKPGAIADANGLVEAEGLPTGFLRIRRGVIETLASRARWFKSNVNGVDCEVPVIFERMLKGHDRVGGDMAFSQKWIAAGGKCFFDQTMLFTHQGRKDFAGRIGDHVQPAQEVA